MKLTNQTLATLLLLGLAVSGYSQGGIDVTGDPVQVGGHDQNTTTTGGQIVIPDEQDPLRQQPPAHAATSRDEEAHKRLDGLKSDVDALRADFEAYKAASKNERLAAYMGDNVRLTSARAKKSRARTALRKKGVSEKTFSEARLFKALEAALKSGKLDAILLERIDGFIADPKTKLGEMLVATQKIVSLELTLYGEGGTKEEPKGGVVTDVQNLKNWAATDPTKPYDPNKVYATPLVSAPPAPTAPTPGSINPSPPQGEKKDEAGAQGSSMQIPGFQEDAPKEVDLLNGANLAGIGTIGSLGFLAFRRIRRK